MVLWLPFMAGEFRVWLRGGRGGEGQEYLIAFSILITLHRDTLRIIKRRS